MLAETDKKNLQSTISKLRAGEAISRRDGNERNAELLRRQRESLEARLRVDDHDRLQVARRDVAAAEASIEAAKSQGDKEGLRRARRGFARAVVALETVEPKRPEPAPESAATLSATSARVTAAPVTSAPGASDRPRSFRLADGREVFCRPSFLARVEKSVARSVPVVLA